MPLSSLLRDRSVISKICCHVRDPEYKYNRRRKWMDLPDNDLCVRHSSRKIFCSTRCRDKYDEGHEPLTPVPIVQEYLKKQDRKMNADVLLYQ
eukprot:8265926-Karenia_brevis.AAC.1